MRASGRSEQVSVYSHASSTPVWWKGLQNKITRADNLAVWQIEAAQSQALAGLSERSMQLQVTVQDAQVWIGNGAATVEITPLRLR
jgi:uncharacterized protein YaeQ